MARWVLLVCALWVVACAAPDWPRHVSTDDGTEVPLRVALTQATERWNTVAQEELGYTVFEPGEGDVTVHPYLLPEDPNCDDACGEIDRSDSWSGWAPAHHIWIDPGLGERLETILTHELGHTLGLDDTYGTVADDGVMGGTKSLLFSPQDRWALQEAARAHDTAARYPW